MVNRAQAQSESLIVMKELLIVKHVSKQDLALIQGWYNMSHMLHNFNCSQNEE
jgi:hypothetical protein